MCITAFPRLARIIHFKRLTGTTMGTVALGAGAIDDAMAWCLLAVVLASFDRGWSATARPRPSPSPTSPPNRRVSWRRDAKKSGHASPVQRCTGMFAFFSSRLGCIGSLVVSVGLTLLLFVLMRGCGGPVGP